MVSRHEIGSLMQKSQPVPYDNCVGDPMSCLLSVGSKPIYNLAECLNSVLNVKVLVGAFNQEKVLVEAFSMIVKSSRPFV